MSVDMAVLEQAEALLRAVWDGIDREYKAKYRLDIWSQVQSRAAAQARMTNDLATFCNRLCATFDDAALAPYDPAARAYIERLLYLPRPEQQTILRALREQTAIVVLLLRNRKQDEKEVSSHDDRNTAAHSHFAQLPV